MYQGQLSVSRITAPIILAAIAVGCGGTERKSEWPTTHPVSGVITIDGAPMPNVMVNFSPNDGSFPARGRTNDAGEYTLRTFFSPSADDEGAAVGNYAVTLFMPGDLEGEKEKKKQAEVAALEAAAEGAESPEAAASAGAAAQAARYSGGYKPRVKSGLPQKYLTKTTSPLTAVVKEGENKFDFSISKND